MGVLVGEVALGDLIASVGSDEQVGEMVHQVFVARLVGDAPAIPEEQLVAAAVRGLEDHVGTDKRRSR